jgi:hypothetical protein
MSSTAGNHDQPHRISQAVTVTLTANLGSTELVLQRVGTDWIFDSGQFIWPEYYNTMAQDGSDDRPDFDAGLIARGNNGAVVFIADTPSVVSFSHTSGQGTSALLTSGTRYAIVLAKAWDDQFMEGNYVNWGYEGNTTDAHAYTGGSPSVSGIAEAFNPINYPIQVELPTLFHADGSTVNEEPFGSVLRTPAPPFPVTSGTVTISGLRDIVQEWFARNEYDPDIPMGICLGPGDAEDDELRSALSMNHLEDREDSAQLLIKYRRRRINIT